MSVKPYCELIGRHERGDGEGITLQDLYELLGSIPRRARDNFISVTAEDGAVADVTGISLGQSDQAEKWEFKAHILTGTWY